MKITKRRHFLRQIKAIHLFVLPVLLFGFIGLRLSLAAGATVTITDCQQLVDEFPDITTHEDDNITIANDIDCTGVAFVPLFPDYDHPFTGILDGQNHTISNLTINSTSDYGGFFSGVAGTTAKDISFVGVTLNAASTFGAGVIAGNGEGLVIDNVHVENGLVNGDGTVGGLVGNLAANGTRNAAISNSSFSGTVSGASSVGGIVGNTYSGTGYSLNLDYNDATGANLVSPNPSSGSNFGGIVGNLCNSGSGSLISNKAKAPDMLDGIADPSSVNFDRIGGLAGTISCGDSSSSFEIYGSQITGARVSGYSRVGGLVGSFDSSTANSLIHDEHLSVDVYSYDGDSGGVFGYLATSANDGDGGAAIKVNNVTTSGDVTGNSNTGGFVGQIYGGSSTTEATDQIRIEKSYATGNITANAKPSDASYAVGGFAGYVGGGITLSQVYASGDITIEDNPSQDPNDIGGLIGYGSNTRIINAYARGASLFSPASPDDELYNTGGLIGMAGTGANTITNVYATGLIQSAWNAGGLTGYQSYGSEPTLTSSYWDTETSNQASSAEAIAVGKTTSEMKTQSTFTSWDFSSIWQIDPAINDGYPYLNFSQQFNPDVDGDGVSNAIENAGPNNGDGNNDGIRDSDQSNVTTIYNNETSNYVTIATDEGTTIISTDITNESDNQSPDQGYVYPGGLIEATVDTAPGTSTGIDVYYPNVPGIVDTSVREYAPDSDTYSPLPNPDFSIGQTQPSPGNTTTIVSYEATDGDSNDNSTASNTITTPTFGLAIVGTDDLDNPSGGSDGNNNGQSNNDGENNEQDQNAPNTGLPSNGVTNYLLVGLLGIASLAITYFTKFKLRKL